MKENPNIQETAYWIRNYYFSELYWWRGDPNKFHRNMLQEIACILWDIYLNEHPRPILKVIIGEPQNFDSSYGCFYPNTKIIEISHKLSEATRKDLDWYRLIDTIIHELYHYKNNGKPSKFEFGGHNEFWLFDVHQKGLDLEGSFKKYRECRKIFQEVKLGWNPYAISWNEWRKFRKSVKKVKTTIHLLLYFELIKEVKAKVSGGWIEIVENIKQFNPLVSLFDTLEAVEPETIKWLREKVAELRQGKILIIDIIDEAQRRLPTCIVCKILSLGLSIKRLNSAPIGEVYAEDLEDKETIIYGDIYAEVSLYHLYESFFCYLAFDELTSA